MDIQKGDIVIDDVGEYGIVISIIKNNKTPEKNGVYCDWFRTLEETKNKNITPKYRDVFTQFYHIKKIIPNKITNWREELRSEIHS